MANLIGLPLPRARFLNDVEKAYGSKSTRPIREITAVSPPMKRGRDPASIEFGEIRRARSIACFTDDIPEAACAPKPTQEMVSAISDELARGDANPQPPHPYIAPGYTRRPWLHRLSAHTASLSNRPTRNSRQFREPPISFQNADAPPHPIRIGGRYLWRLAPLWRASGPGQPYRFLPLPGDDTTTCELRNPIPRIASLRASRFRQSAFALRLFRRYFLRTRGYARDSYGPSSGPSPKYPR